jgi:hypothetical protein
MSELKVNKIRNAKIQKIDESHIAVILPIEQEPPNVANRRVGHLSPVIVEFCFDGNCMFAKKGEVAYVYNVSGHSSITVS